MNGTAQSNPDTDFQVDPWTHFLGGLLELSPGLCRMLGNLETRLLADALDDIRIVSPVYITGLARSGSTLLLEMLDWHPDTASHRYRDFPMLHTPYWWSRFLDYTPRADSGPAERAHRDGIQVTPESPEAFEEVLWMKHFPDLHRASVSSVLDGDTSNPDFEAFYRDHIRKLLLIRQGRRYLSKANYNITRLEYLLKIFPDARFVVPVRNPVWHIASLMKQHRLFCAGQKDNPRALKHLQRVGHFEFGLDRRPINTGDARETRMIAVLWKQGKEVEAWARYWNSIHGFLAERLERNERLREAALVVPFEELCRRPRGKAAAIFEHCRLPASDSLLERCRERIRFPAYYRPNFTYQELTTIESFTAPTLARLGLVEAVTAGGGETGNG
ncbi:sulfotransferase family protein [Thiohalobacter thiocyanaticus]|uniref:Sulfotransferase n=1 Tax=Thiohalobacter thiocyanaticus TaxID=585455 RepID=A0A426QIX2_9GAMM|nr:sulfotransferase [Thiohalobacter thiocyanaticus]RRQ21698.1 sulfotransferase [Thiohalobacter thiocyanaticus]